MARKLEQHTHPDIPRLYIQLRSDSKWLQAIAFVGGRKQQSSLRTQHLPTAFRLAEDWYRRQERIASGDEKRKDPLRIPIMQDLWDAWKLEVKGSKLEWAENKWGAIARFWEAIRVTEVTTQTFKEFYKYRRSQQKTISNATLHQDIVLIRQLLKHAVEEAHIKTIPTVPSVGQIDANPRPWLTRVEWELLTEKSRDRIREAKDNPRLRRQREELDNQMVWMVNTMMRVGEMLNVRFRDCRIAKNSAGKEILICEVKGKRGIRTIVGRSPARDIYKAYKRKGFRDPNAHIFPVHHREAFTELLKDADLYVDPLSGFERNFKSLRCTAISFAVLAGVDLMWIARNAGTSITMIDSFYARRLSAEMAKDELTKAWN